MILMFRCKLKIHLELMLCYKKVCPNDMQCEVLTRSTSLTNLISFISCCGIHDKFYQLSKPSKYKLCSIIMIEFSNYRETLTTRYRCWSIIFRLYKLITQFLKNVCTKSALIILTSFFFLGLL